MSAVAQILLKVGMAGSEVQTALEDSGNRMGLLRMILLDPYILIGFALYGAGTILWLFVLARVDVSVAYPWIGLAVVMTMSLSLL